MNGIQFTFGLVIVGLIAYAIYSSRSVKTTESFYVANRNLSWFWITGTYVATAASAGTILGILGNHYSVGMAPMSIWTSNFVAGGFLFAFIIPKLARTGIKTLPEFMEKRFDSKYAGLISGIVVILAYFLYMAGSIIALGLIFNTVFNIPYVLALLIGILAIIITSSLGGVVTVTKTDTFAAIISVSAIIIVLIFVLVKVGGMGELVQKTVEQDPNWFTWNAAGAYPALATFMIWFGRNVGAIEFHSRFFAAKSQKDVYKALIAGVTVSIITVFAVAFIGAGARVLMPGIVDTDNTYVLLVNSLLPDWLAGIALSAVALLAISTINTQLLISGQAVAHDIVNKLIPDLTDKRLLSITRIATVLIGLALFTIGVIRPGAIMYLLTIAAGFLAYAFAIPIALGIWWKKGNKQAFIITAVFGMCFQVMGTMNILPLPVQPVLIGLPICLIIYIIFSLVFPSPEKGIKFQKSMHNYNNRKEELNAKDYRMENEISN